MGVWGAGNFENDVATDIVASLHEQVRSEVDAFMEADERGGDVDDVEVIVALGARCSGPVPDRATVAAWKQKAPRVRRRPTRGVRSGPSRGASGRHRADPRGAGATRERVTNTSRVESLATDRARLGIVEEVEGDGSGGRARADEADFELRVRAGELRVVLPVVPTQSFSWVPWTPSTVMATVCPPAAAPSAVRARMETRMVR